METKNHIHPNDEIQQAIVRLTDLLCEWERNTSRQSVLILHEHDDYFFRALNGKPSMVVDFSLQWFCSKR